MKTNVKMQKREMIWHIIFQDLNKLINRKLIDIENIKICIVDFCEAFVDGKLSKQPFRSRTKSNRIMEIIYFDIR